MEQVLKHCGDDLTRANIVKQAANVKDFVAPMLIPGIPIERMQIDAAEIRLGRMAKTK